jgi:hypothetical protein
MINRLPIVGYIVIEGKRALEWFEWTDGDVCLVQGDFCTMFHTRRQANLAIQKTIRMAKRRGLTWLTDFCPTIYAVRPGEPSRWKRTPQ